MYIVERCKSETLVSVLFVNGFVLFFTKLGNNVLRRRTSKLQELLYKSFLLLSVKYDQPNTLMFVLCLIINLLIKMTQ